MCSSDLPLKPEDVFSGAAPVLRGKWVDYSSLQSADENRHDPALLNAYTQINAAGLMGFGADRLFASAHVVHPMQRSVFASLFAEHRAAFENNIQHRFRDTSQFLPQGLHNHACIKARACTIETANDHLHLRTGAVLDYPLHEVRAYLRKALHPEVKFLCVNDLPEVEAAIPDTRLWIERAIRARRKAA